jgi:Lhr-like helicase
MQRKRAHDLLAVASRYGSFPIILETYRECLQDVFDLPAFVDLARRVESREIRLVDSSGCSANGHVDPRSIRGPEWKNMHSRMKHQSEERHQKSL